FFNMLTSIITGDIIKSREISNPENWLSELKKALSHLETNTRYWEIFRGDSFQIEIKDPKESFKACIYLKACIKLLKILDVRVAIAIGNKSYDADTVT